ncbi:MAG: hypothetical protein ACKOCW_07660 [Planctomycetaceae bacterium]
MARPHPSLVVVCLVVLGGAATAVTAAEPAPSPDAKAPPATKELSLGDTLDPAVVYRYEPLNEKLAPIPRKDLKPGHVYLRHSPARGGHVWSRVDAGGTLRYDIGPGSSIPVRYFDPVADQETRRKVLETRAPELARRLAVQGGRPSLRLDDTGRWRLDQAINEGRVFDRETGQRFEWHMGEPVPVINTAGNSWIWTGTGYRSPVAGYGGAEPVADQGCGCW